MELGHEEWKFGTVAGVAGAGTRRCMPDEPGVGGIWKVSQVWQGTE